MEEKRVQKILRKYKDVFEALENYDKTRDITLSIDTKLKRKSTKIKNI